MIMPQDIVGLMVRVEIIKLRWIIFANGQTPE